MVDITIDNARGELSLADLDVVCGGLNPQPLPPMPRPDASAGKQLPAVQ